MSLTCAFSLDCFLQTAKLLTIALSSDSQVPLKSSLRIIPSISHQMLPQAWSVTHVKIALPEAHKPFFGCSFSNRVLSVDGTNVSGSNCSFGASIKLVKNKVSEMFIFLNWTLHNFGPENFVPLVKIRKFQKGLIEENESYKMVYYT
jgi:hypothetical protein